MNFVSRDSIRLLVDGCALIAFGSMIVVTERLARLVKDRYDSPTASEYSEKYHYHGIEEPG